MSEWLHPPKRKIQHAPSLPYPGLYHTMVSTIQCEGVSPALTLVYDPQCEGVVWVPLGLAGHLFDQEVDGAVSARPRHTARWHHLHQVAQHGPQLTRRLCMAHTHTNIFKSVTFLFFLRLIEKPQPVTGRHVISPGSMASSFPLISLFMPSVRASNITCSR